MRLRAIFTAFVTGLLVVGSVWAGVGLSPLTGVSPEEGAGLPGASDAKGLKGDLQVASGETLGPDEVFVGAAKISLEPNPGPGDVWERDKKKCLPASTSGVDPQASLAHVADWRTPWIENTNCIYMGGYGLGPTYPILNWDSQYGLWVRSTVFQDAQGDTLVLTLLDAEGYFGDYNRLCGPAEPRCGAFAIADDMADELDVEPDGFIIASTHAHTALDLIGGWGGVPAWYMDQVTKAIKDSIRQAYDGMTPATLEAGDTIARRYNGERRNFYRSAEDPTLNWVRAIDRDSKVVATVGTFATHPVNYNEDLGIGHGDFPPAFSAKAEQNQGGGVASLFQAGLGNMTGGGGWETKGHGLADTLPALGAGTPVPNPDVRVAREFWNQPVTNGPLGTLGGGGFFDKPFAGPASVEAGKRASKPCRSASPVSAKVNVVAAKIGSVVVTSAPGEIFANYSNTIEERSPITALAMGQANDALGYMPQSFETDHAGRQGTGFWGGEDVPGTGVEVPRVTEYEDAYSIDHCFGDVALETTLRLLGTL